MEKFLKKKYRALEDFKNRLLNSEVGDLIAKIILYGSLSQGRADEDSDIDLMVFAVRDTKRVEDACDRESFEVVMEHGESVEPMIYPVDELRFINSPLVWRAKKYGKEIYSMEDRQLRLAEAQNYLLLAEEFLKIAENNFKNSLYRGVIDAAYNAAELCVKGLILLRAKVLPKRHSGFIQRFSKLYIDSGEVKKEMGRALNKSLKLGNRARYEYDAEIREEDALSVLRLAEGMIDLLTKEIKVKRGNGL